MAITKYNRTGAQPLFKNFFDDQFVKSFFNHDVASPSLSNSKVNIQENDNAFYLEYLIPGANKKDIKIDVENSSLIVSYEHSNKLEEDNGKYTRREFAIESSKRVFELPENVNTEEISAKYENGILYLTLPKETPKENRKTISIK